MATVSEGETAAKEERSRSRLDKGRLQVIDHVPGDGFKGPRRPAEMREEIRKASQEAPEAIDRLLWLGHDPAVVLHDFLGTSWANWVMASVYLIWIGLVPASLAIALVWTRRSTYGAWYVTAVSVDWCLGGDLGNPLNRQVLTDGIVVTRQNVDSYVSDFFEGTLPYDYHLMSRVANPDTWDPQNGWKTLKTR